MDPAFVILKKDMAAIRYFKSEIELMEGDVVEYRSMLFRWHWKLGRISYVPGVTKFHPEMEHNGLQWVGVSGLDGTFRGVLVEPEMRYIQKSVRFIRRLKDRDYLTPDEISEEDW